MCCLKLRCVQTHTVTDPATHKESNLSNYSSYVVLQSKRCMNYIPPQCVPKVRPMSILFHHHNNNICMQLNSTNYDVAHYTTAYSAFLHEVSFFNKFPHVSRADKGAVPKPYAGYTHFDTWLLVFHVYYRKCQLWTVYTNTVNFPTIVLAKSCYEKELSLATKSKKSFIQLRRQLLSLLVYSIICRLQQQLWMTWENRSTGKKSVPVPLISQYIYTMGCIFSQHFSPETISSITTYYFDDDSSSSSSSSNSNNNNNNNNNNNRRPRRRHNHVATRILSIFAHSAQSNHCTSIRPEAWTVES